MEKKASLSVLNKIDIISESLREVAPEKNIEDMKMNTSIRYDLGLDSIEIMDLLISLREKIEENKLADTEVDIDRLIAYLFRNGYEDIKVESLCDFIEQL